MARRPPVTIAEALPTRATADARQCEIVRIHKGSVDVFPIGGTAELKDVLLTGNAELHAIVTVQKVRNRLQVVSPTAAVASVAATVVNPGPNAPAGAVSSLGLEMPTEFVITDSPVVLADGGIASVGVSLPSELVVTNSPVTSEGTITAQWTNESPNMVFAGPASGAPGRPGFRPLALSDMPAGIVGGSPDLTWDNMPARVKRGVRIALYLNSF